MSRQKDGKSTFATTMIVVVWGWGVNEWTHSYHCIEVGFWSVLAASVPSLLWSVLLSISMCHLLAMMLLCPAV